MREPTRLIYGGPTTGIAQAIGRAYPITFAAANDSIRVLGGNDRRAATIFQNRGPGLVFLNTGPVGSLNEGIRVDVNATLQDQPPGPIHQGEWWAMTDTAGTVLVVQES